MNDTNNIMPAAGDQQFDHAQPLNDILWRVTMEQGEPTLSEQERNIAEGVITLFYKDGDYRNKFFHGGLIIDYLRAEFEEREDIESPVEEAMMVLEERAEGIILKELVPLFTASLANMSAEEEEPAHAGYEVYWRSNLLTQVIYDE